MSGTSGNSIIGLLRAGEQAYYDKSYVSAIKAIRIGTGMNRISSLNSCTNLKYITVPSTVNYFGSYNRDLYSLKSLTLPKITSGTLGFYSYLNLKNISVSPPTSLFPIYGSCPLLEYASFPSRETEIIASTFSGNRKLKTGAFENVVKINGNVF